MPPPAVEAVLFESVLMMSDATPVVRRSAPAGANGVVARDCAHRDRHRAAAVVDAGAKSRSEVARDGGAGDLNYAPRTLKMPPPRPAWLPWITEPPVTVNVPVL